MGPVHIICLQAEVFPECFALGTHVKKLGQGGPSNPPQAENQSGQVEVVGSLDHVCHFLCTG